MSALDHQPNRPFWDCRCCGEQWPCLPAREHLVATAGGSLNLAMLMWSYYDDYVTDAGPGPLTEAYGRFLAWARCTYQRVASEHDDA